MRLVVLLLFLTTGWCRGEFFPRWSVHYMCADADAIIIGDHLQDDTVKVTKWIRAVEDAPPDSIEIAEISKHSKTRQSPWYPAGSKPSLHVDSRHFIAFLQHREGRWQSLATIGDGSCGVFWLQKGRCYWYEQGMNPGPYDLSEVSAGPKTEPDLLREIEVGMKEAAAWNKTLQIEDPSRRAEALVAYTMESTSPESSPRLTFRFRTREPLSKLGSAAVPALRNQIGKWRAGDSLNEVVLILYDLGQAARDSVPDLVALLKQPERAHPCSVIVALKTAGSPTVVNDIRPFLTHSDQWVRRDAAEAIDALTGTNASKRKPPPLPVPGLTPP
jgi:hypothetical protein